MRQRNRKYGRKANTFRPRKGRITIKKKYYLTLDTETATLPFVNKICHNDSQRQKVAIAKPLVYDIGWVITDRQGNIIKRQNYLIQETFFVPAVFNTAYYRDKRPIYMDLLEKGEISAGLWNEVCEILLEDLKTVDLVAAYNAAFDFKKAIPFTEEYIESLYSANYQRWEDKQLYQCRNIAAGYTKEGTNPNFLEPIFRFRNNEFPIADLWQVACEKLVNNSKYKDYCLQNKLLTASAQYFKSSAETTFQYVTQNHKFTEDHTALSDAEIEAEILTKALKKGAVKPQMTAFPFRKLGTTIDYVMEKRPKYAPIVLEALTEYFETITAVSSYQAKIENLIRVLEKFIEDNDL